MIFVYILQSQKDQKYYIGHTDNIERRLQEHNREKSRSVKNRAPFLVIHKEVLTTKTEAIKREKQIKKYKGGEAFRRLIQ